MRSSGTARKCESESELPPLFAVAERRMTGRALDQWRANGGRPVDGFDDNSLFVAGPAGLARISAVGGAIGRTFGLSAGMTLHGQGGLAAKIYYACDLVSIEPGPIPFEASLAAPAGALLLVRAVLLPVDAAPGHLPDRVQIIVNWREVLDLAATRRLRRELGVELRLISQDLSKIDPFSPKIGG